MTYNHTQIGYLIIFVGFIVVLLFGFIITMADFNLAVSVVMFAVLFVLISFASLNVMITEKHLRIKFGYGIFRKRYLLEEIISARVVKNHWYYGWGIRLWFWPSLMIIYNVSGFDAVEIKMRDGKIRRIGTDEPRKLESVINREITRINR